MFIQFQLYLE